MFSLTVIVISIGSLIFRGINFGLDFTGGTLVEVEFAEPVSPESVRETLAAAGLDDAVVQNFGSEREVLIRVPPQKGESQALLGDHCASALAAQYQGVDLRRSEFVGPAVGDELMRERRARDAGGARCRSWSTSCSASPRKFAIGAVVALIHDGVVTVGAFSVFQWTFDLPALAAVLAVIGYSVNDTIVVADRIRENFRKLRRGTPIEIVNISLTQTLDRTIMTSFTTLLVVLALFLFGGEAVRGFSMALIVGIAFGTYSSTYVAAAIVLATGQHARRIDGAGEGRRATMRLTRAGRRSTRQPCSRSRCQHRPNRLQHRFEHFRIAGDDVAGFHEAFAADQIADETARFPDQQRTGRDIPRLQSQFPESVGASCRDVGEIERGRTGAANAATLTAECAEHRHVGIEMLCDVLERNAGRKQRIFEAMALADANTFAVELRAGAARRGEFLVAHRIDDHRMLQAVAVLQADRHREMRNAVQVVRGAVERIDDPRVFGAAVNDSPRSSPRMP